MESPARRSFLMGRRQPLTPWQTFVRRLSHQVAGEVTDFGWYNGAGNARLQPANGTDVRQARALCAEAGVLLALEGVEQAQSWAERSVLWVDPGSALARCEPMADQPGKWFVQPGCQLRQLADAGLAQFEGFPGYLSVAAWLADRTLCDWGPGQLALSGLLYAGVLLDDGSTGTLGPFGRQSRLALSSARLQRCIPALFELARSPLVAEGRAQPRWPCRYRLDALVSDNADDVNLAHLLPGHGGDLVWVEWLVFEVAPETAPKLMAQPPFSQSGSAGASVQVLELDCKVKQVFDPSGVFPEFNQML